MKHLGNFTCSFRQPEYVVHLRLAGGVGGVGAAPPSLLRNVSPQHTFVNCSASPC